MMTVGWNVPSMKLCQSFSNGLLHVILISGKPYLREEGFSPGHLHSEVSFPTEQQQSNERTCSVSEYLK